MSYLIRSTLLACCLLWSSAAIFGQKAEAARQATALTEGTLIVVFPPSAKKESSLQRIIDAPETTDKTRKRLKKRLSRAVKNREAMESAFKAAFNKAYPTNYELRFSRQEDLPAMLEGDFSSLDKAPVGTVFFARFGVPQRSEQRFDAMVLMDDRGIDLRRPFFYTVRINGLDTLFSKGEKSEKSATKIVRKMLFNIKRTIALGNS